MKILIVDDNELFVEAVLDILDLKQFKYESANNGAEALKKFREFRPDLVLLDLGLPDIDGIALIKKFKIGTGKVKVLVLSGDDKKETIKEAKEAGADEYFVKPFSPRDIAKKLSQMKSDG